MMNKKMKMKIRMKNKAFDRRINIRWSSFSKWVSRKAKGEWNAWVPRLQVIGNASVTPRDQLRYAFALPVYAPSSNGLDDATLR